METVTRNLVCLLIPALIIVLRLVDQFRLQHPTTANL